jgi:integrase
MRDHGVHHDDRHRALHGEPRVSPELKALTWEKIDLERGVVIVDEAYDRERDENKSVKTGNRGARRYTIEPTLMPLLRAMHAENGGGER